MTARDHRGRAHGSKTQCNRGADSATSAGYNCYLARQFIAHASSGKAAETIQLPTFGILHGIGYMNWMLSTKECLPWSRLRLYNQWFGGSSQADMQVRVRK